jgi:hypothetical protein
MAAHTRVQLIRPSKPPALSGPLLAEAIWEIFNTGVIGHQVGQVVQLRYGKRVDADKKGTAEVAHVEDYQWDVEQDFGTMDSVLRHLQTHGESVYRAYIGLGELDTDLSNYLTREPHPANPQPMSLSSVGFEAGAISVGSRERAPVHVGWLAFTLSGRGVVAPWTPEELIERVRTLEAIAAVETMLAQRWPVTEAPGFFERMAWKKLGARLQPVFPARPSWVWGVTET